MRILFISSIFPHGTARVTGTFNLELCRALAAKHDVRIVAPRSFLDVWRTRSDRRDADSWVAQTTGLTVTYPTYFYTPGFGRSWYGDSMWWSLRRHLHQVAEDFRAEAVVSYWAHPDGEVALRLAQPLGIPSVVIIGGSDVLLLPNDRRRRPKIQQVLRESSGVMTVSDGLRRAVIDLGAEPSRVHAIYQGIDDTLFFPGDATAARQRLNLSTDRRLLLWVGRMAEVKGLDSLIAAFDLAHRRNPDLQLLLVGDGPLRASVQEDVNRRGLRDHVVFVGAKSPAELPNWYRAANLFVLSSRSEGLPNVLREAIACGRPFVSTDVGSVRELADSHGNAPFAELVPAGDSAAMSIAIERMLRPEYLAAAQSISCRSWRDTAHDLVSLLRTLRDDGVPQRDLSRPAGQVERVPHEVTV